MVNLPQIFEAVNVSKFNYTDQNKSYLEKHETNIKITTHEKHDTFFIAIKGLDTLTYKPDWRSILNNKVHTVKTDITQHKINESEYNYVLTKGHAGYIKAFESIKYEVEALVSRLTFCKLNNVVFCGHGAYGALAQILFLVYRKRLEAEFSGEINCISFAAPKWLATESELPDIPTNKLLRIENKGDYIPALSYRYKTIGNCLFLGTQGKSYLDPTRIQKLFKSGFSFNSYSLNKYEQRLLGIVLGGIPYY